MPLSIDDLQLAWRRVLKDHADERVFVTNPIIFGVLSSVSPNWLAELEASIANRTYAPGPAALVEVPKGRGGVRPGTWLQPADQVVYTACVGKLLPQLIPLISFDPGPIDHAYQIEDHAATGWLKSRFKCWEEFRTRSIELLEAGSTTMISADITGFYDHIALEILFSDLRDAGLTQDLLDLLGRCISRWAMVNGRGIPQGMSASDILAKLYLTTVDRALREAGLQHVRYVDDYRIFCEGRPAAKRGLLELARALRRRGLSLQTAKTEILPLDRARNLVDGIIPTLKPLARNYLGEIAQAAGIAAKYLTIAEAEDLLERRGLTPPTEMLREAYRVLIEGEDPFDTTMLHYLLNRLGRAKDTYAVDHSLGLLQDHPEETQYVLRYLTITGEFPDAERRLVDLLTSPEAVYPYQHFQVIQSRLLLDTHPSDEFLGLVRRIARAERTPSFLQSACVAFLGKFGSAADLEALAESYPNATSDYERAEILCSLHRLEQARRNALLGQARQDGFLAGHAVRCVRDGRVPSFLGATNAA